MPKPISGVWGPRLGSLVKKAAGQISGLNSRDIAELLDGKTISVEVEGHSVDLEPDDVIVERKPKEGLAVASEGDLVVALEMTLNQELILEGLAREFVNKVQITRKSEELEVTQRIELTVKTDGDVQQAVSDHVDYIKTETLSKKVSFVDVLDGDAVSWDLNGHPCLIKLKKAEKN